MDGKMFEWLHFFDVLTWWKWILAVLLGCALVAFIVACIIGIGYVESIAYRYICKILGNDSEDDK